MTATATCLRRATGGLFLTGAVAFTAAATVLSSTFDWPDILDPELMSEFADSDRRSPRSAAAPRCTMPVSPSPRELAGDRDLVMRQGLVRPGGADHTGADLLGPAEVVAGKAGQA